MPNDLPNQRVLCTSSPSPAPAGFTVQIALRAPFEWDDRAHGSSQAFWLWVEDSMNEAIYHTEYITFTKKQVPCCSVWGTC